MSTDHIDAMLRKKAEAHLDAKLKGAVDAFTSALNEMYRKRYADYRDLRSMALNLLMHDKYERSHFMEWMNVEAGSGKERAKAIANIHRQLAKEFIAKVDKLGEEVDALRDDVAYHEHN